tara:strand:- start:14935 stop:15561 length:627 start_codon:yes stop_codon:yes gene_type:complete
MQTQALIVIKKVIYVLLIFLVSCNQKNTKKVTETNSIISYLVTVLAQPVIPPPSSDISNIEFEKKSDSIHELISSEKWLNQPFTLWVDSTMRPLKKKLSKITFNSNYNILFEKLNSLNEPEIFHIYNIEKNDQITIVNQINDSLGKTDWKKIDMKLSFSRIAFSDNYNNAILIVYVTRGKLNGYSELLILEKNDNTWRIKEKKLIEIS